MAIDPRAFARTLVRLNVVYTAIKAKTTSRALTRDVGGEGLSFLADAPLELGEQVKAELSLPDRAEAISFTGEVTRCTAAPETTGSETAAHLIVVKFVMIDPKQLSMIQQYVRLNALPLEG
ncbi:MAG: PilZ domain-containing protein [Candidatus Omnitrophica bacterium]|nr:PilZ domain-containing protein [Candidatus Omnitrophota bacterium]